MKALMNELNLAGQRMQAESFQSESLEQELEEERLIRKTCQESETHMRAELKQSVLAEKQTAAESKRCKKQLLKELSEVRDKYQEVLCKTQYFDISDESDDNIDLEDSDEVPDHVEEENEQKDVQGYQGDEPFLLGGRRRSRVEKEQNPETAGSAQCGRKRPQVDGPAESFHH